MAETKDKVVGTIHVGSEPFFEVVDKGDAHLEIRFVYEPERSLRLPKKLVSSLTQILKAYDGHRRHPRYAYSEEALVETADNRVRVQGRTSSISENGVFVETPAALPVGAEVMLKIPPKSPALRARAVVRNVVAGVGLGLEFSNVAPASRPKLAKLLQSCSEHSVH